MRVLVAVVCAWMMIGLGSLPGHAEKRVALIVGNAEYQHADKLANPVTDARRMREALAKLKFEVVYGENLGKQALEQAIRRFADAAQEADVALAFYAGHGSTFGDAPYLVPVDARFASLGEMPNELVQVEALVGELRRTKGLRIAIFYTRLYNPSLRTGLVMISPSNRVWVGVKKRDSKSNKKTDMKEVKELENA